MTTQHDQTNQHGMHLTMWGGKLRGAQLKWELIAEKYGFSVGESCKQEAAEVRAQQCYKPNPVSWAKATSMTPPILTDMCGI